MRGTRSPAPQLDPGTAPRGEAKTLENLATGKQNRYSVIPLHSKHMTPKPTAASCSTHVAGAEVPKTIVLLRIPAGFVALGAAGVRGMDPDLQPCGIISNLTQCGLLAPSPPAGAHIQHLVFPLLHLLSLGRQNRLISPRDERSGKVYHFIHIENQPFPASQAQKLTDSTRIWFLTP